MFLRPCSLTLKSDIVKCKINWSDDKLGVLLLPFYAIFDFVIMPFSSTTANNFLSRTIFSLESREKKQSERNGTQRAKSNNIFLEISFSIRGMI